jgi:hypothetical protein
MGTSARIPGPRVDAGPWRAARRRLRTWQRELAAGATPEAGRADDVAAGYLEALAAHLRAEPAAFGLQAALQAAGVRLAVVLPRFVREQHEAIVAGRPAPGEDPAGDALRGFVDRVAGDGARVVDSAVRRAATRTGGYAVAKLRAGLDPAGDPPHAGESPLDLAFCAAYAFFFADAVGRFVATLTAEQEPFPPGLPDPVTALADRVVAQVAGLVPDPCAGSAGDLTPAVLGERAVALVDVAVRRVLGLPPDNERAA